MSIFGRINRGPLWGPSLLWCRWSAETLGLRCGWNARLVQIKAIQSTVLKSRPSSSRAGEQLLENQNGSTIAYIRIYCSCLVLTQIFIHLQTFWINLLLIFNFPRTVKVALSLKRLYIIGLVPLEPYTKRHINLNCAVFYANQSGFGGHGRNVIEPLHM